MPVPWEFSLWADSLDKTDPGCLSEEAYVNDPNLYLVYLDYILYISYCIYLIASEIHRKLIAILYYGLGKCNNLMLELISYSSCQFAAPCQPVLGSVVHARA